MESATCKFGKVMFISDNELGGEGRSIGGGVLSKFTMSIASKATYFFGYRAEDTGEGISSTDVFSFGWDGRVLLFLAGGG